MSEAKKPEGVKVAGALLLVLGVFNAVFLVLSTLLSGLPADLSPPLRIFYVICPFLLIASGIGLQLYKNWARLLSIGLLLFVAPFLFYAPVSDFWEGNMGILLRLFYLLFYISIGFAFLWIVFYLLRPKIRSHFK